MADTRLQRARKVVAENFEKIKAAFAALLALPGKFFGYLTGRDVATSSVSDVDVVEPVQENSPSLFSRTFASFRAAPGLFVGKVTGLFVKAETPNLQAPEDDTPHVQDPVPPTDLLDLQDQALQQIDEEEQKEKEETELGASVENPTDALEPTTVAFTEAQKNNAESILGESEASQATAPVVSEKATTELSDSSPKKSRFPSVHLPSNPFKTASPKLGLADGGLEGHKKQSEKGRFSGVHKGISGFFAGKRQQHAEEDAARAAATAEQENPRSSSSPKNSGS